MVFTASIASTYLGIKVSSSNKSAQKLNLCVGYSIQTVLERTYISFKDNLSDDVAMP